MICHRRSNELVLKLEGCGNDMRLTDKSSYLATNEFAVLSFNCLVCFSQLISRITSTA